MPRLGGIPSPSLLNDLRRIEPVENARMDIRQEFHDPLVDHRFFLLIQCDLQGPTTNGHRFNSEPAIFYSGQPDLRIELEKGRLGRCLLGCFTFS